MRPAARLAIAVLLAAVFVPEARGEERPVVVVTPGSARTFRAALQTFADRSTVPDPARAQRIREDLGSALEFSSVFEILSEQAFLGPVTTVGTQQEPGDRRVLGIDGAHEEHLPLRGGVEAETDGGHHQGGDPELEQPHGPIITVPAGAGKPRVTLGRL